MAYKLKDLIDNPDLLKSLRKKKVDEVDDYYEKLGEEIEKYPICNPLSFKR